MPRIILTRPQDRSEALAADIEKDGWDALIWPLLTIQPLLSEPIKPSSDTNLVFTSARGVEALPDPIPRTCTAWCVGPATAAAARKKGFGAVIDTGGDATTLVEEISSNHVGDFLHVRGEDTRGEVVGQLRARGLNADDFIVYRAEAATYVPDSINTAIKGGKIDAIALFSPRTAATFVKLAKVEWSETVENMTLVAISEAAASPVLTLGFGQVIVADAPNGQAMRAAICGAATWR